MHASTLLFSLLPLTFALPSPAPSPEQVYATALRRAIADDPSLFSGRSAHDRNVPGEDAAGLDAHGRPQRMVRRKMDKKCKVVKTGSSSGGLGVVGVAIGFDTTTASSSSDSSSSAAASSSTAASSTSAALSASTNATPQPVSQLKSTMDKLMPISTSSSWTTSPESSSALSFTAALKPLTSGKLPESDTAPDGSSALVANYPAGTFKYSSSTGHGFSFYSQGAHAGVDVTGAREVLFSYSIFFPDGFEWVKGGKLPGVYGGTSLESAKSCSGGRQDERDECFSARMMWRSNGAGEFYNYYPTSVQQGNGYCQTAPYSICDTVYGDSVGRGSFTFPTGKWATVAQRLKLNDPGSSNGEQQLWVDGVSIMNLSGLQIVVKDAKIYGIMAQTFFGGSDSSWASPKDQSVWFKDWTLAVVS